jgi:hypothetical protein
MVDVCGRAKSYLPTKICGVLPFGKLRVESKGDFDVSTWLTAKTRIPVVGARGERHK